jgi:predicted RNA-binding Zn ribbon-like protein
VSSHYHVQVTTFRTGNGAAWLDLLATLLGRYRDTQTDAIDSTESLRAWLRAHALEPVGSISMDDVARIQAAREAMHRAAVASVRGEQAQTDDVRLLDDALAADRTIRVRRDGTGLAIRRPASASEALARLVRDAVQDLSGPQRSHLRFCGDDDCSGIYLDHTGRRRWCSDDRCGNRMRVRAHRARARQP